LKEVDRTLVAIDEANTHLKQLLNPFRIRLKGQALYLRGMYPAKPGDGLGNKRYELPMGGASTQGLRNVVTEAFTIEKAIKERTFDWRRYIADQSPEEKTASQWIKEFKPHYMSGRKIEESTWEKHWASTLRKLPQSEPLQEGLLLAVVLSTKQDSRVREQTCQRLQRFAEFAGIKIDLNPYIGNYEPLPRDIPEDAVIVEWRDRIPNPAWQWVYGVVATFGLRPHEVFSCEFKDLLTLKVHKDTKTGERITRAIRPEWAERWALDRIVRPNVRSKTINMQGNTVSRQFNRYGVPFNPYDLRHAWAIRASVTEGLSVSTAAKMMGHSVATHTKIYHKWLSDAVAEREYNEKIRDRPKG
jgi:integrase